MGIKFKKQTKYVIMSLFCREHFVIPYMPG